jgi:hypothetical protein
MAPAGTTSLARLLIISAIDLLLCCFTMGVMLFLVFQPSQRGDRSSALSNLSGGTVGSAAAAEVEGEGSPAILVITSRQNNLDLAALPPSFVRLPSTNIAHDESSFVFTNPSPDTIPRFSLKTKNDHGPTEANIWLSVHNRLNPLRVRCNGGAQVTFDLSKSNPLTANCAYLVTTGCPLDDGRSYPINTNVFDSDSTHIVQLPPQWLATVHGSAYAQTCLLNIDYDKLAQLCNKDTSTLNVPVTLRASERSCIGKWYRDTSKTPTIGRCYSHTTLQDNDVTKVFSIYRSNEIFDVDCWRPLTDTP